MTQPTLLSFKSSKLYSNKNTSEIGGKMSTRKDGEEGPQGSLSGHTSPSPPPSIAETRLPEQIRAEENAKKLEEKYWRITNEEPEELIKRTGIWLGKNSGTKASKVAILLELVEDGIINDFRNPMNKGKNKIRLEPMNWNLLTTLALMMKEDGK
jgi:hypothetical protein